MELKAGMKFRNTKNGTWVYMISQVKGIRCSYKFLNKDGEPFGMEYPVLNSYIQEDIAKGTITLVSTEDNQEDAGE